VGGNAQTKAMRKVAGRLRLDLAQYRELASFAQFGSDLDEATQAQLTRGARTAEVLKQGQFVPMPLERQVMIIWTAVNGYLDSIPLNRIKAFEELFSAFVDKSYPDIPHSIRDKKIVDDATEAKLKEATEKFKAEFTK
jgi:F-type H+-transporting ATPase subunit alpha